MLMLVSYAVHVGADGLDMARRSFDSGPYVGPLIHGRLTGVLWLVGFRSMDPGVFLTFISAQISI